MGRRDGGGEFVLLLLLPPSNVGTDIDDRHQRTTTHLKRDHSMALTLTKGDLGCGVEVIGHEGVAQCKVESWLDRRVCNLDQVEQALRCCGGIEWGRGFGRPLLHLVQT